ncbi:MAG: gluconate 2-dehydrogenase subunit 3 family protein [Rhizobacter sp.]
MVALVPVVAESATRAPHAQAAPGTAPHPRDSYAFFNASEIPFIEAAVDRLIPPDAVGPSAMDAGVNFFIDKQLAGAWGAGERLYRAGPWVAGKETQGYQLPYTPAELYRTALRGIRDDLAAGRSQPFEKLGGAEQDRYLTLLESGSKDLHGVPGTVFFESLLAMTIEGYFGDPVYGGNRGMAAWQMIGFPGAYANFYELVDQYNVRFDQPPRSLAEDAQGHIHPMPDLPAALSQRRS